MIRGNLTRYHNPAVQPDFMPNMSMFVPREYVPSDLYEPLDIRNFEAALARKQKEADINRTETGKILDALNAVRHNPYLSVSDGIEKQALIKKYRDRLDELSHGVLHRGFADPLAMIEVRKLAKDFSTDPFLMRIQEDAKYADTYQKQLEALQREGKYSPYLDWYRMKAMELNNEYTMIAAMDDGPLKDQALENWRKKRLLTTLAGETITGRPDYFDPANKYFSNIKDSEFANLIPMRFDPSTGFYQYGKTKQGGVAYEQIMRLVLPSYFTYLNHADVKNLPQEQRNSKAFEMALEAFAKNNEGTGDALRVFLNSNEGRVFLREHEQMFMTSDEEVLDLLNQGKRDEARELANQKAKMYAAQHVLSVGNSHVRSKFDIDVHYKEPPDSGGGIDAASGLSGGTSPGNLATIPSMNFSGLKRYSDANEEQKSNPILREQLAQSLKFQLTEMTKGLNKKGDKKRLYNTSKGILVDKLDPVVSYEDYSEYEIELIDPGKQIYSIKFSSSSPFYDDMELTYNASTNTIETTNEGRWPISISRTYSLDPNNPAFNNLFSGKLLTNPFDHLDKIDRGFIEKLQESQTAYYRPIDVTMFGKTTKSAKLVDNVNEAFKTAFGVGAIPVSYDGKMYDNLSAMSRDHDDIIKNTKITTYSYIPGKGIQVKGIYQDKPIVYLIPESHDHMTTLSAEIQGMINELSVVNPHEAMPLFNAYTVPKYLSAHGLNPLEISSQLKLKGNYTKTITHNQKPHKIELSVKDDKVVLKIDDKDLKDKDGKVIEFNSVNDAFVTLYGALNSTGSK